MELLTKFESIGGAELDMNEKYMRVLMNYGKDLEAIRKAYQKYKSEPLIPRNLPPVAGRIAWSRQLYRKIEHPMKVFKTKPEILKVCFCVLIMKLLSVLNFDNLLQHPNVNSELVTLNCSIQRRRKL